MPNTILPLKGMRIKAFFALPRTLATKGIGMRVQSEPVPRIPAHFTDMDKLELGDFKVREIKGMGGIAVEMKV
jgi:hypothetical protein